LEVFIDQQNESDLYYCTRTTNPKAVLKAMQLLESSREIFKILETETLTDAVSFVSNVVEDPEYQNVTDDDDEVGVDDEVENKVESKVESKVKGKGKGKDTATPSVKKSLRTREISDKPAFLRKAAKEVEDSRTKRMKDAEDAKRRAKTASKDCAKKTNKSRAKKAAKPPAQTKPSVTPTTKQRTSDKLPTTNNEVCDLQKQMLLQMQAEINSLKSANKSLEEKQESLRLEKEKHHDIDEGANSVPKTYNPSKSGGNRKQKARQVTEYMSDFEEQDTDDDHGDEAEKHRPASRKKTRSRSPPPRQFPNCIMATAQNEGSKTVDHNYLAMISSSNFLAANNFNAYLASSSSKNR
jgi:hypothetical protein